ncbi:MAG TPA: glycosyltransferase family 4 protein [Verrucomicrobiae bacterium]|jgi:glycosyltransferase involved in cell wall biosynthesis
MRVVHLLRKYNPDEWGGTETALLRLLEGLRPRGVDPIIYYPATNNHFSRDPLLAAGYSLKPFHACVPYWGMPESQRQQLIAVGGNLMSFDLFAKLRREEHVDLIHTHALGRLGGIASSYARNRGIPSVVSIHGGVLDLPEAVRNGFANPQTKGLEWGKIFGLLFRSRRVLAEADAIITVNPREAALLHEKYPDRRIQIQPHGVPLIQYKPDHRSAAFDAFPELRDKQILLSLGRIDPIKNQNWLLQQAPQTFAKHPDARLVFVGACTDAPYGKGIERTIDELDLRNRVLLTGGLPPDDPRLLGLLQAATLVLLPSISETFGLVLLEAWAARTSVLSSRTSGASALIQHRTNGWLFDLDQPHTFHEALDEALTRPEFRQQLAEAGHKLVSTEYDTNVLAGRIKKLYDELIEEKHALRRAA